MSGWLLSWGIRCRPTDAQGVPVEDDGSALGSVVLRGDQLTTTLDPGSLFAIDFSPAQIAVSPGEVLAVVLRSSVPFAASRAFAAGGFAEVSGYPGGEGFVRAATWALQNGGGFDFAFRTYVPEPEATSAGLCAIGVAAGVARRRLTTPPSS